LREFVCEGVFPSSGSEDQDIQLLLSGRKGCNRHVVGVSLRR
jgi:hypothetical protein